MVKYCIVVHLPCTAEEYMILKDDPEYVRYQLGEVGARELSRVSELGADGFVTQTIVNRPNIAVPRVLRPLLRGKDPLAVLTTLAEARYPIYGEADVTVDVGQGSHGQAVDAIHKNLRRHWRHRRRAETRR